MLRPFKLTNLDITGVNRLFEDVYQHLKKIENAEDLVKSLNDLTGPVSFTGGDGIDVDTSGDTVTVSTPNVSSLWENETTYVAPASNRDVYLRGGASLKLYSGMLGSEKYVIDGDTGFARQDITVSSETANWLHNSKITYNESKSQACHRTESHFTDGVGLGVGQTYQYSHYDAVYKTGDGSAHSFIGNMELGDADSGGDDYNEGQIFGGALLVGRTGLSDTCGYYSFMESTIDVIAGTTVKKGGNLFNFVVRKETVVAADAGHYFDGGIIQSTGAQLCRYGLNIKGKFEHGLNLTELDASATTAIRVLSGKPINLDGATGTYYIKDTGANINGTVQMDGLRIDITPTAETPVATHTAVINLSGTNYRFLCLV